VAFPVHHLFLVEIYGNFLFITISCGLLPVPYFFLVGIYDNLFHVHSFFLQGQAVQVPESRAPAHHFAPSSRLQTLKNFKSCLRKNDDNCICNKFFVMKKMYIYKPSALF
jgi:hypothetical protein